MQSKGWPIEEDIAYWFQDQMRMLGATPEELEILRAEFAARERGTTTVSYWHNHFLDRIRRLRNEPAYSEDGGF